ncbi:hypothetical protein L227DRAFT_530051 [Lentinus tigrinus ALCF2SS1-6]|uniref:Protein kinase domain-containing protein n=1 Tax=Lentinus tigrinus ALCF2SS1-6 TaxID=1328759 RepID=A0A5C2S1Y6_9APHY|nr:hypothetical protein L227DRAFT_530051 [Lentinus tigrinus ALCF2SS1-6]
MGPLAEELGMLNEWEIVWRDRYEWLQQAGYTLRPRYHPGWKPSWKEPRKGPKRIYFAYEDGVEIMVPQIMDAVRTSDGSIVVLKEIRKSVHPFEIEIGRYFSTPPVSSDARNHCCPILDVLQDPGDPDIEFVVMPLLRLFNDPPFVTVGEVMEFLRQAFEGLQFMHEHHVAHRDCGALNVMMDSRPILPNNFHPQAPYRNLNGQGFVKAYTRTAHPVRYYFTDFGISRKYSADNPNPMEVPIFGGDKSVPEHLEDPLRHRNPFRTDVYYLGSLMRTRFLQVYTNLTVLEPLVARMTQADPDKRPTMDEVVASFGDILSKMSWLQLRTRLVWRRDGFFMNVIKGVYQLSARTIPHMLMGRKALPTPQAALGWSESAIPPS